MDIIYEKSTSKDFTSAIEKLKSTLSDAGFGVLWEMNFKETLQAKGQDFDKNFVVLEVCNAAKAKGVLDRKIEAGYMLPCKMAIYEKDGQVRMGMIKPETLIGLMSDDSLKDMAKEVGATLQGAIDQAV